MLAAEACETAEAGRSPASVPGFVAAAAAVAVAVAEAAP